MSKLSDRFRLEISPDSPYAFLTGEWEIVSIDKNDLALPYKAMRVSPGAGPTLWFTPKLRTLSVPDDAQITTKLGD